MIRGEPRPRGRILSIQLALRTLNLLKNGTLMSGDAAKDVGETSQ